MTHCLRSVGAGFAAFFVVACSTNPPFAKTYPASGVVRYKNGEVLKGGSIQFISLNDSNLRVTGAIESDGAFRLFTTKDNWKEPGAPAGDYRVTVQPPALDDLRGGAPPGHKAAPAIMLEDPVLLEAKENRLSIVIPGS